MNQEKRKEIIELTNMVIRLCLIAGSTLTTAYNVGAAFASGLEREFNAQDNPVDTKDENPSSNTL